MRSETLSVVAALVVHAGVLLIAPHFIDPNALAFGSARRAITPIDIDLSELKLPEVKVSPTEVVRPPEVRPEGVEPPPEGRVARSTSVPQGNREPSGAVEPGVVNPSPDATAVPGAPPGPAGPAPDHYDPLAADDGRGVLHALPGLGSPIYTVPGVLADLPRAAPAPTDAPRARPVDPNIGGIVVAQAMTEADKKKGFDLPAAGTVNSAAKTAVQAASNAPDTAKVSFEVRLGPGGNVMSVRVASFNGGSSGVWDQVARAIQAALAGRNLELTAAYAKGATVYVDVSSSMTLPSGSTSAVSQQGSGISFDSSDIGAHKHKSVRASFRTVAAR